MRYWRANWPNESIPPKIHFLEDHIVEFIEKWKVGLGFYGEQGKKKIIVNICLLCRFVIIWCYSFYLKLPLLLRGESIHHEFRNLRETYCGMENDVVGRLLSMLKRHHVTMTPSAKTQASKKNKRSI